jgi:hypothetical protein
MVLGSIGSSTGLEPSSRDLFRLIPPEAAGADALPHLPSMDGDAGIGLEPQTHAIVLDLEDRDLEQLLEGTRTSHHD